MGFFSGRLTCQRFKVAGRGPRTFGQEHLDKLAAHAMGKARLASADGTVAGWIAADHILDTRFDLAKNVIADTLHFALRMDSQAIPGDLLRAYTQIELQGPDQVGDAGIRSAASSTNVCTWERLTVRCSRWSSKRPGVAITSEAPPRRAPGLDS